MYFPKPAINENDLAIIERGDTAEHSIEAGRYVSWKGKLGKANSAILQGATLDDSLFSYETDGVINSLSNNIKTLWSGSSGVGDVNLSESIENFKFVAICIQHSSGNRECKIIPTLFIEYGPTMKWDITYFQTSSVYSGLQFTFTNSTKINIDHVFNAQWSTPTMTMVIGIS